MQIGIELMPPQTPEKRNYIHLEKIDDNLIMELSDGTELEVRFRDIYTAIGALARLHSREEYFGGDNRR